MATLHSRLIGSHGSPQHAATRALAGAFISLSLALLLTGLHEATAAPSPWPQLAYWPASHCTARARRGAQANTVTVCRLSAINSPDGLHKAAATWP